MINKFLLSKYASIFPTKLLKKIIKKKKVYFVKTSYYKLPKNSYPFRIKKKELSFFYQKYKRKPFSKPISTFPKMKNLLQKIFCNKKFVFLDYGGQYIDNYLYLSNFFDKIEYFYLDNPQNNKIVKNFIRDKKIKNFKVINSIYELKKKKIDFINFGSVLQYINDYKNILNFIKKNKPKYILISGIILFKGKVKSFVCKQVNVWPQINYCFFFNKDYFNSIFVKNNYIKVFFKKNLTDKRINFSNINDNENNFFQYSDIFYKRK